MEVMQSLTRVKEILTQSAVADGSELDASSLQNLDNMIARAASSLTEPQTLGSKSLSIDNEILAQLNIVGIGFLVLKPHVTERIQEIKLVGSDKLWSSTRLHHHLKLLEKLIPKENTEGAYMWIEAFFSRVSAMVSPGQQMVFKVENTPLPKLASTHEFTNYVAIIAETDAAECFYRDPQITVVQQLDTGFFLTEVKGNPLYEYIPQAVCRLYGYSKQLKKEIIRGGLTNGHEWLFIILYSNKNGEGASYKFSTTFTYRTVPCDATGAEEKQETGPDVIAGILLYWIQRGFEDINEDDWFEELVVE
ncbi:hypothetical protein AN958_12325 [Leucoagaricus sp. SymC.cos]|nr:hypothetical protein AN958_12325 [Leucoagaricus sp. SymC.cos]